jgi:hypothetical protein
MNWPINPVIHLDGENIDGENNALVETGSDAYEWVNTGSNGTPFTRGTVAQTPLIKKFPGSSVVSFDGRSDMLSCLGTAASLAFMHQAAAPFPGPVWDLALVLRRMGTQDISARVFGVEGEGLGAYSTPAGPLLAPQTIEGGYQFFLSNGTDELVNYPTQQVKAPLGEISPLFIRCDGNKFRVTQNFWDWEEQAFLVGAGAGPASHDYAIGSTGGNSGISGNFFCFDLFDFLIWPRNLDESELDQVLANFVARGDSL